MFVLRLPPCPQGGVYPKNRQIMTQFYQYFAMDSPLGAGGKRKLSIENLYCSLNNFENSKCFNLVFHYKFNQKCQRQHLNW